MKQNKRTSKGSNDKIPTFAVGDIVKIVPNHKPYSRGITRKYPHSKQKENIGLVCFVEQVVGNDRYSLYALEQPVKPCPEKCNHDLCKGIDELGNSINCEWYYGDTLESCLEPCSIKCEDCNDLINKMPINAIKEYKHFIYPEDVGNMLLRIKEQDDLT